MRNFHFTILLPFVFIQGIFFQSVNGQQIEKTNKSPKYPNYKLKVEKLLEFGSGDLNKEKYLLGRAADIAIDSHGNVYICDDLFVEIKKFDKNGKYIKTIGSGKGRGPGEFITPRRIQLDENDNLFVLDYELRRLTQFDQSGVFLKTLPIKIMKACEFQIHKGLAYIVGFRLYGTRPIHKIDFKTEQLVGMFGNRTADSLLIARIGNGPHIVLNSEDVIYYADYFPYRISVLSSEGKPINSFSRKASFIRPPYEVPSPTRPNSFLMQSGGGIRDISLYATVFPMVLVNRRPISYEKGVKTGQYIDIFDSSGNWILTIPIEKYFNNHNTRQILSDKNGNIYLTSDDPFPHVEKFSIDLRDENGNVIMQ